MNIYVRLDRNWDFPADFLYVSREQNCSDLSSYKQFKLSSYKLNKF